MLSDYEQTIPLSHHPWPQPQPQNDLITAANDQTEMAQQNQSNQNQKQEALRCPRCESSNTKFCYYNNYSLSQPRHFCKACKRYWTRGGTLRNVPVGGGCRKNKRVRKPAAPTNNSSNNLSSSSLSSPCSSLSNIGAAGVQSTANHVNHLGLLYGMPVSPNPNPNLPNYNLHHLASSKQFQEFISSSSPLLGYTSTARSGNHYGTILPSYGGMFNREVKEELEGQNRQMDQNNMGMMEMGMGMGSSSSDPSLFWGGVGGGGGGGGTNTFAAWLDPSSNLGSSVPSLI